MEKDGVEKYLILTGHIERMVNRWKHPVCLVDTRIM